MKKLLLTAMRSGTGKTVMTSALLAALKKRGMKLCAFKCGPDYIDPMFHSRVLGIPCRNLDLFLQGKSGVRESLLRQGCELALIEGAMGYYDGLNGTDTCSAWDLANTTDTPAVLLLRPGSESLTLAAQVRGLLEFRQPSRISALLLTDCSPRRADSLSQLLERESGLPLLGSLPPLQDAVLESRHLGLLTAGEVNDFAARFGRLAEAVESGIDLDRLLALASEEVCLSKLPTRTRRRCRIAVARDEAFCFLYEDSLDALREAGAELIFFSPLRDPCLPGQADGLYLCGGYPELHARTLAENTDMRLSIRRAVSGGLPTVAECGGFLYLQQSLEDDCGCSFPMCGVLPGTGVKTTRLQRFGYQWLSSEKNSLLFRQGERIPAHEFHYWDSTENGSDLFSEKADGRRWPCGYASETLYAAFPHLHLSGSVPLAERFTEACARR